MSKRKHSKHQKIDERIKLNGTEDQDLVVSISDYLPSTFSLVSLKLVRGSDENATIAINEETGEITVTPDPDYNGTIHFRYIIENECGETFVGRGKVNFADTPEPIGEFIETSPNVFEAVNDLDSVFEKPSGYYQIDVIGKGGNDTITTNTWVDRVWGGDGNDNISTGDHNDFVNGGSGADIMDGGTNDTNFLFNDRLSYEGSSASVDIDLSTGTASSGDAEGDIFTNFEDIEGSSHNDTLIGDENDNIIEGGAGADYLDGGSSGANGDMLDYQGSDSAVSIDLRLATASGGDAEGDYITDFENLRGSAYNDTLNGDDNHNIIIGGAGSDVMNGKNGNDTFIINTDDLSDTDIIDGGLHDDAIEFINNGSIDLSTINASNIEHLILSENPYFGMVVDLTLTLQDVIDITPGNNDLMIFGSGADSVTSTGQGWVQGVDQVIDGETLVATT